MRLIGLAVILTAGLTIGPVAQAQPAGKMHRIGFLSHDIEPSARSADFVQGLRDLGYVEGRDFVMEYRWAAGNSERLPDLAAELVRARVDIILTRGTAATVAAKQTTRTIPIVFGSAGVPVEKGIVASLARPGGNVTGLALHVGMSKALELLKESAPDVLRVVHVYDPSAYGPKPFLDTALKALQPQAGALNLKLQSVALRHPDGAARVFAEVERATNGFVLENAGLVLARRDEICGLALQRRLPAVGRGPEFAHAGCLASYGENVGQMYRSAATYVDKILKGAKPADLPVEQPTTFELVINLKTAKALGLTIPQSVVLRADRIIE